MKLSEEVKNKIIEILDSQEFKSNLYEGLTEEKRKELGQFYTPGKLCIQMIEKFDCDSLSNKNILDPTCGSGNLLIACLIAGADSDKLFGNEYDSIAVDLCRKRLNRCCDILNKPHIKDYQIHQGNALGKWCLTDFSEEYLTKFDPQYIDDENYINNKQKQVSLF
ncbi:N-6 DNA methylase [Intestinibacter sp.]|uniref:N-6 DNA methylase n=1 Tax=Intestinibacter sp. TaxID=1965304 RepID=UPI002A757D5A|nr:N-6 DNA methylase [Intestinibacter sp.]MDY2735895.1 N-6 DNA methylase [Intestinibacter sp.]